KVIGTVLILAAIALVALRYSQTRLPTGEMLGNKVQFPSNATSTAGVVSELKKIASDDNAKGYNPAVEIVDPTGFVNTEPFRLADLVGKKVILVDFWTYSCINCIR